MRTFRTSVLTALSFAAVGLFFGCVVNNPPAVDPTTVPPAGLPEAGTPTTSLPDATVPSTTVDAGPAKPPTATADAAAPCLQQAMCTTDKHFDTATCACVANATGPSTRDGGVCLQVTMCMTTMHFDNATCRCVKN